MVTVMNGQFTRLKRRNVAFTPFLGAASRTALLAAWMWRRARGA
jgi:hypothetical protein